MTPITPAPVDEGDVYLIEVARFSGVAARPIEIDLPEPFRDYLEHKRDLLISELRRIDRLLGRPQTVPVRGR